MASTLVIGAANADPKGEAVPLDCDNGESYVVWVNGNGEFTPGHAADSTAVLVPVAFGDFHGIVRDTQGNIVDEFDEPPSLKGNSARSVKNPVTCDFEFTDTSDGSDPSFPEGFTFEGSGSVIVSITPRR